MILVLSVLEPEISPLVSEMVTFEQGTVFGRTFSRGVIGRNEVIAVSGIFGKVESAFFVQKILDLYKINMIFLVSGAGALTEQIKPGEIVVGEAYQEFDRVIGLDCRTETIISDIDVTQKLREDFPDIKSGKIISGDQIVNSKTERNQLFEKFRALALDMDSAAVAKVAKINGIRFVSIKVILDLCDENTQKDYDAFFERFSGRPAVLLSRFLEKHFCCT